MLDKLDQHPPAVTKEDFYHWKQNPITAFFLLEIEKYAISNLIAPIPLNYTGPFVAYRNDGMRELAEFAIEWTLEVDDE